MPPTSKSDSQPSSIVIQLGGNGAITIQSSGKTTGASKVTIRSSLDELKQEAVRLGCKEANLPKRKADLLQWIQQRNQTPQVATTIQISDGTVTTSSSKTTKKSVATTKKAPAKKGTTIAKGKVPTKKVTTGSATTKKPTTKSVKQAATGTKATSKPTGKVTSSGTTASAQTVKATAKNQDSALSPAKKQSPGVSTTTPNGKRPSDTLLVQWLNSGSKKPKAENENDRGNEVGPKKTPATVLFPANNATASSIAAKSKLPKKQGETKPKSSASSSVKSKASKETTDTKAPQPTPAPVVSSNVADSSTSTSATNSSKSAALPRISNKLTLAELQHEATARGHDKKNVPKLKSELLHFLLDGSIHLSKTKAYQDFLKLKAQIESERGDLYEKSLALKLKEDRKREEQRESRQRKLEEEKRKQEEERNAQRNQEIAKQEAFHVHAFPLVHPHKFAKTSRLCTLGKPRFSTARCDLCRQLGYYNVPKQPVWTCEKCDFDVCQVCFSNENRTHEEKEKARELKRQKQREAQLRWEEQRRAEELEEEIRWDATKQFSKSIISPDENHKRLEGSKMKGFTVYCSSGYDADRWHSYEGEPTKYFDTTWKTKKEANDRARYLFFWKNSYGVKPDEIEGCEGVVEERTSAEGMISFTVRPADSERWTVSVCPDQAYKYLDHASASRHDHDDRDCSESSYSLAY